MPTRRLIAFLTLVLVGGILAACGTGDDPAPTATVIPPTAVSSPTEESFHLTPQIQPMITATANPATPEETFHLTPQIQPMITATANPATPEETFHLTPQVQPIVTQAATPSASPAASPVATQTLIPRTGTLTLEGREQQDFTITDEGCVGLGDWQALAPGTQVIVRDAANEVVDIATLEAGDGDGCTWSFAIDAPESGFFSVSIPMVLETWFDGDQTGGDLELTLP